MTDWPGVRLHVVTGKGGTGKTTVAAALAIALASDGGRVLLLEVEGRGGLAQLFDVPPLGYDERRLAAAPNGGDVHGLAVDAEDALLEYLEMFYNLRRAGTALKKIGAIDFATTIAPGVRDVLLTGKAKEAVRRKVNGQPVYDAVVLDAPPTGRITKFLNVNHEVADIAKVGPIRNQADGVMAVIGSRLTVVHIVTLLEAMPVQETLDGARDLKSANLAVGAVIVNMIREPVLPVRSLDQIRRGDVAASDIAASLGAAGLLVPNGPLSRDGADVLLAEATEHASRVRLERSERKRLRDLERPTYDLPWLASGIDMGALYELARQLRAQGVA